MNYQNVDCAGEASTKKPRECCCTEYRRQSPSQRCASGWLVGIQFGMMGLLVTILLQIAPPPRLALGLSKG